MPDLPIGPTAAVLGLLGAQVCMWDTWAGHGGVFQALPSNCRQSGTTRAWCQLEQVHRSVSCLERSSVPQKLCPAIIPPITGSIGALHGREAPRRYMNEIDVFVS